MKKLLQRPYYLLNEATYATMVMLIVPLMNFLGGVIIDIAAPSMPDMVHALHASLPSVKNTITAVVLGCGIGAPIAGGIFDKYGRRKVVFIFLVIFILSNFFAVFSHNIVEITIVRFLQGVSGVALSVGTRAIMADHFTGREFTIGLLYVSLAFSVGSVMSPYIGGYLQHYFGWHASFYFLFIMGILCFILFAGFIHERYTIHDNFSSHELLNSYLKVIKHKVFIASSTFAAVLQFEMVLYPAIGPFLVVHQLHGTAITYGKSSLLIAAGYMAGTLTSRVLVNKLTPKDLMNIGLIISVIGVVVQFIAMFFGVSLWGLVLPFACISFAAGFFFINLYGASMKLFPGNIGVVFSSQLAIMMLSSALLLFILSHINITNLFEVFIILLIGIMIKLFVYHKYFKLAL